MADMLVKLYALPATDHDIDPLDGMGITVRRPMVYERQALVKWVSNSFNSQWSQECAFAFSNHPIGCYIALHDGALIGFCCVNCTFKNFVGPIGVVKQQRRRGVGRSLLWSALYDLRLQGYAYAIIGDAGEPGFFEKAVGAVEITDSKPGPYPPKLI